MPLPSQPLRALAAALLLALGAPACGDGSDGAAEAPSPTAPASIVPVTTAVPTSTSTSTSTTSVAPGPPRALVVAAWTGEAAETAEAGGEAPLVEATPDPHVRIADLTTGTCIQLDGLVDVGAGRVEEVEATDCALPHDAEIYALVSLDDDPGSRHPGDEHVLAAADRVCLDAFAPYVGAAYVDTRLEIVHMRPTAASWTRGDRRVICAVVNAGAAPLEGSVAGAGAEGP
jgi:hypothetical protein